MPNTEILDKIIRQKRAETSKKSPDIMAYVGSLGADWERVKNDFIKTNIRALVAYNNALFAQFSQLQPKLDLNSYNKLRSKIEYGTLTHAELKRYSNLSNTQQLFLHQIINNNRIKKDISLLEDQIKNLPDLDSALSLLQDFYHYDDISHYFVDVQISDPSSFRLFQLLNNYALTQFTRIVYNETLGRNETRLAQTIKDLIKNGIDAIKESDHVSTIRHNSHSVDGFQAQLAANVMSAIKKFFKSSEEEHNEIVDAVRKKIPSLLQISFDETNFANLKIRINELIDLEKTVPGFKLTLDFFEEYIQACYPSDLLGAIQQARSDMSDYIDYIRSLRTKAGEIDNYKKEKIRLTEIQNEVQKLWLNELCSSKLLSVEKQEQLRPILEKLSDTAVKKLIGLLVEHSDFISKKRGKIDDFLRAYNLQDNAGILFDLLKMKFDEQHTTIRADYYHNLLKGLSLEIATKESAIAEYVDSISDHASAILQNAEVFDDLLLDGDYLSITGSKFYNLLDNKLKKFMPSQLEEVLKNLSAINKEVLRVSVVINDGQDIRASYTQDTRSKVKDSYSRLESLRNVLAKKHDLLASNLMDLLNEEIAGSLQQQVERVKADYDRRANRWFGAISVIKRRELDKSLETGCEKLSKQLALLKTEIASFQNSVNQGAGNSIEFYSKDKAALRRKFFRLDDLINELEKKDLHSSCKFDFSEIKGRLKILKNYFSSESAGGRYTLNSPHQKQQDSKIEFKSKKSFAKTILNWAWRIVQALKALINLYRIVAAFIRAVLYTGFILYSKTLGIVIFAVIRHFSNKKVLFQEIDELYGKVSKLHSSKIKAISGRTFTDPDDSVLRAQIAKLADLKGRIEALKNNSHHLLTKTTQMMTEYQQVKEEFDRFCATQQKLASSSPDAVPDSKAVSAPLSLPQSSVPSSTGDSPTTSSPASEASSPLSSPDETRAFIAELLKKQGSISDTVQQKCYKEFLSKSEQDIGYKFAQLKTSIVSKIDHYTSHKTALVEKNKKHKTVATERQVKRVDLQIKVLKKLKKDLERLHKSAEYRTVSAHLTRVLSGTITGEQLKPIDNFHDKLKAIADKIKIVSDVDSTANSLWQTIFNIVIGGDENSPLETILTEKGDKSFAPSLYRRFIDLAINASSDGEVNYRKLFIDILTEISENPKAIEEFTPIGVLKGMQSKIIVDAANKALSELNKTDGTKEGDAASLINASTALRQVLGSSTYSKIFNAIGALGVTGSLQIVGAGVSAVPVGLVGLGCGGVSAAYGGVSTVVGSASRLICRLFVSSATQRNEHTVVAPVAPVRAATPSA